MRHASKIYSYEELCLNPCCNGIYSMSGSAEIRKSAYYEVLILVVMEYTQWERLAPKNEVVKMS